VLALARRRTGTWSVATIIRFLRNGRGAGDGKDYKPWITIYDFPSKGRVARVLGKKTGRIHHLLSQLELIFFLLLDADPDVEDIKEQFPLPLDCTLRIAAELGIEHPMMHGTPYVMTTDFYYKKNGLWHAVQIKPSDELEKDRVKEKFAIEKAYYDRVGIDWKVVTEKELPRSLGASYKWLMSGEDLDVLIPNATKRKGMITSFLELYHDETIPFRLILKEMDRQCAVTPGTTMQIFKSVIRNVSILVNLYDLNLEEPRQHPFCVGNSQVGCLFI